MGTRGDGPFPFTGGSFALNNPDAVQHSYSFDWDISNPARDFDIRPVPQPGVTSGSASSSYDAKTSTDHIEAILPPGATLQIAPIDLYNPHPPQMMPGGGLRIEADWVRNATRDGAPVAFRNDLSNGPLYS